MGEGDWGLEIGDCGFALSEVCEAMIIAYTLRPATEADHDFLLGLHLVALREAVEATWGWDEAFQRSYFEDHWDPGPRRIIVMDGEDAGVLQVESYVDEIFLALILIAPAFQGQGLGTAVICDVQAQARAAGLPLTLQVLKANPRARRLYERLGFEVVEEREERYVMRWEMGD